MNWPMVKLGELFRKTKQLDPRKFSNDEFVLYSIPAYDKGTPANLRGGQIGSSKTVLSSGDVLLSKIVPHIRRSWVVSDHRQRILGSSEWIVLHDEKFDSNYLRQFLVSDMFHQQFMTTVAGVGGSLNRARPAAVARLQIPLPPLEEQKRIAAILRVMETQILRVEKETELLHQVRFAAFARLSHQTRVSLNDVVEIRSGQVDPKHPKYRNSPHVAPNALMSGETAIGPLNSCAEDRVTSGKYRFEKGDVLYSKIRPYLNKVVVAELDGVCSADMYALVPKAPLTPYFLRELLATPSFLAYADRSSGRSSIPKINRDSLMRYELNIPLENEIEKFSKVAVRIQQQIGILNRKRSALELLRVSLASRLFSKNMG